MENYLKNRPSKKTFPKEEVDSLRNKAIEKIKSELLPNEKIIKIILIGSSIKGSFGKYNTPGFRGSLFSDFDFIVFVEDDYELPSWLDKEPAAKPFLDDELNIAYRQKKMIENQYDVELFFIRKKDADNPPIIKEGEKAGIPMADNTRLKYMEAYVKR